MDIHHRAIQQTSHGLPHPTKVVPFGNYGGGLWTGHPIGLVIVIGLLFMGFVGLPEARWVSRARPFLPELAADSSCGLATERDYQGPRPRFLGVVAWEAKNFIAD